MTVTVTYPGVYLQEKAASPHSVVAVTTADTAFIDYFKMGPVNQAVQIQSLNAFSRIFGGLDEGSEASYGIQQFFQSGGGVAWVVRVVPASSAASSATISPTQDLELPGSVPDTDFTVSANSPGAWGDTLAVGIESNEPDDTFNLTVQINSGTAAKPSYQIAESYYKLSVDPSLPNYAPAVVNPASQYIVLTTGGNSMPSSGLASDDPIPLSGGEDGAWTGASELANAINAQLGDPTGTNPSTPALEMIAPETFNLLCLPATSILDEDSRFSVFQNAQSFCEANRAFYIVDPPAPEAMQTVPGVTDWNEIPAENTSQFISWVTPYGGEDSYWSAVYFPFISTADALNNNNPRPVAPSGTLAGIYAATDNAVGVWKAPAGVDAQILSTLMAQLTNNDSGQMNPLGYNALRTFPIYNNVVWGARTLAGADLLQSAFKYINVRRLTNFIELSLVQSLKWAVFESNAPPLWSSISLEVSSFMSGLFGQGAFQGTTPTQAYFVQCDSSTTTQQDIQNGIVNVVVGFAPVYPAEFVVLTIEVESAPTAS